MKCPRLSYLEIEGAPFDAGRALGRFGAAALHEYAQHSAAWASVMRYRGTLLVDSMSRLVRLRFPRVWDELQGLAIGLERPFEEVFLWNCRGDLWAMAPDGDIAVNEDGCTTVQQAGTVRRITHNEDGDPAFAGHCAIAAFEVAGGAAFAAFIYPGSIAGHTFAVTDGGLAMTVNNLRCRRVRAGIPRMVLARALLDVARLDQALALIHGTERAGGFHLTLAHRDEPGLLSVEFSSEACAVVTIDGRGLHANHALHAPLRQLPQIITASSQHRQRRGQALLAEAAGKALDPLRVLADAEDAGFPILRADPLDSDAENTLATADIHVGSGHIEWQVHPHPAQPPQWHLRDGHAIHKKDQGGQPV
ncbi:peptidase C45 [Verminephrobacter eiseniae]|uniref:C45 family autoproteolytic acyltransferase/hydolase n=1 Tax=Verminephrobacter eiseniae TaxID=364317 RepID=UPI0022378892|nr:C45 family peptidase [Verminephrobacter eiseniae]MCW5262655.1 peptidase C45 [Verminephrobacter eiseniae]